jgi:hypothetical protein
MQLRLLIGSSVLAAIVLTGAACAGTISDEEKFDNVIGAQAELVQKKRAWLAGYDRHCGVCFEALELCKKGAADPLDATNCEAALNACVRGGLISDGDAGANSADASNGSTEAAAAIGDDADAGADPGEANALDPNDAPNADAGQPAPFGAADAGRRPTATRDSSAFVEDAGRSDAGVAQGVDPFSRDAGGRARPVPSAGDKQQLEQSVDLCLTNTHDCLGTAASAQSCVGALRDCVRTALERTLANVCTAQLASCRAQAAPANATRSVERLCRRQLDFASDTE